MASFEKAVPKILIYEGGYVNDPDDPGGETNRGIIDRLDGKTDGLIDIDGDGDGDVKVRSLTEVQAKAVYKRKFWDVMHGDEIQFQPMADILFDAFVNTGHTALRQIQRILNLKQDGNIGPVTIKAINSSDPVLLYNMFKAVRIQYYKDLAIRKPVLKKFLKGWLNRINSFKNL